MLSLKMPFLKMPCLKMHSLNMHSLNMDSLKMASLNMHSLKNAFLKNAFLKITKTQKKYECRIRCWWQDLSYELDTAKDNKQPYDALGRRKCLVFVHSNKSASKRVFYRTASSKNGNVINDIPVETTIIPATSSGFLLYCCAKR